MGLSINMCQLIENMLALEVLILVNGEHILEKSFFIVYASQVLSFFFVGKIKFKEAHASKMR